MAYSPPTLNSYGIITPSYDDVIQYLVNNTKRIYGDDIYLDEDSQDYQMLSAFALLYYDLCQCLILDYNSHNPDTAVGTALDRIAAYVGITRQQGTASTVLLTCTGEPGTSVGYGAAEDVNGYIWQLETEFTIPESGSVQVNASCNTMGAIQAPIGTINKIRTPTSGWVSVTNEFAATMGTEIETDSHLRARLKYAAAAPSLTVFDGIISNVQSIQNVIRIKGYENFTSDYDDLGLPPHSIAIVVEGGDEEEIAQVIYNKKTPGTDTYGTTSVPVITSTGQTLDISFSRPQYVNLNIVVNVTKLENYTDAVEQEIKNNILNELTNQEIGQSLYASSLYYPVLAAISDITMPTFFTTSITVNGGQKVDATAFQLLTSDISLITVNATELESGD